VPLAVVVLVAAGPVVNVVAAYELEDKVKVVVVVPQVVSLRLEVIQHLVAEEVWFGAAELVDFELE
jgi:hypothetical protein